MAEYRYDGEKAKQIPENMAAERRLVGEESPLGIHVQDYLRKEVVKILLAKNNALLQDDTKSITGEMRTDTSNDSADLDNDYLKNLVIKNKEGQVITSLEEMNQWVSDNFYFCLEDQNVPNAWIMQQNDAAGKNVIAFTSKMIEMADNAAQFEGVIAHELGHYFVQKRYGEERARRAGAINEKMADMHAADCLVYMGKNPEEYKYAFQKLTNITDEQDPIGRLILSMADEHGGDASRIQDIADYNETIHGKYLDDYYLKEEPSSSADDQIFAQFKQRFKEIYPQGSYITRLEDYFIKDESFSYAINQQNGRIDFSQIKYEDALDKLTDIAKNEEMRFSCEFVDAAQILQQSSKDGLEITPELEHKATLFMSFAADSVYFNEQQQENERQDRLSEQEAEQYIAATVENLKTGKEIPNNIENVLIAEEFQRSGYAITPKELGERLKQLPSEDRFSYNGKNVTRSDKTYIFKNCARTDKQKKSDARKPTGFYFSNNNVIKNNKADYLAEAIILEAYQKDGTILTSKEVALKLHETLKDFPDAMKPHERLNYNGTEVFISPAQVKEYLLVYYPQSSVLSDQDRLERFDDLQRGTLSHRTSGEFKENLDSLLMAVSYPEIDFVKFNEEYQKGVNTSAMEIELSKQVLSAKTVRVEPFSYLRKTAKDMQQFINGEIGTITDNLPRFSRFAINMPTFEMPEEEVAKGTELPWLKAEGKWLKSFGLDVMEGKSVINAEAKDYVIKPKENLFEMEHYMAQVALVHFPQGKPYQIIADENGKISATGEKATQLLEEQKKADSLAEAEQISSQFRERIKVLDALICLTDLKNKEKAAPLTEEDKKKQHQALNYLCTTENLESKIIQLTHSVYRGDYYEQKKRQQELAYTQMPEVQKEKITEDLAFLQQSDFYKRFMADKNLPENPKELIKFMEKTVCWNVGEKTPELLQTIVSPAYSVLEMRRNTLESSKKIYSRDKLIEKDLLTNIETNPTVQNLQGADKQQVLFLELSLKEREVKDFSSLLDFSSSDRIGVTNDSAVYTKRQSPYYEKMREIFNMQETAGNPERLYQNLTANFTENELIKTEEQQQSIYYDYHQIARQPDNLEEKRKIAEYEGKYVLDAGQPKLQGPWIREIHKIAEYETARYLNNPENPKVDVLKLLKAYPCYENNVDNQHQTPDFQNMLADYILEKSDFKQMGFYAQKEIYDLMVHKNLFDKENETKAVFAEELKKSYGKLPETEKEKAALSMLQDNSFSYTQYQKDIRRSYLTKAEKTSVVSSVDVFSAKHYFIEEYAQKFIDRMGKEPLEGDILPNGKLASIEDVKKYHSEIKQFIDTVNATTRQSGAKEKIYTLVADGIEAQPELAEMFKQALKPQDNEQDLSKKNEFKMRGLNGFNELLSMSPNANLDMITFFTEPYSDKNVEKLRQNITKSVVEDYKKISARVGGDSDFAEFMIKEQVDKFTKEDLHNMYEEFWDSAVEERAVVMQRFLNNATQDDNALAIDICLDKYVDKDNPYYEVSKEVLNTLYRDGTRGKFYTHDQSRFMIGAMLAADRPVETGGENKKMSVGDAMAKFCSSNGPAWVKFGQALSNLPMLPPDIRKPMSVLKDKAVSKKRWEIMDEIKENMPPQAENNIRRFGAMLGAGSFWETVSVEMNDGSEQVLQMMSPDAKKNAEREFAKIVRTIEDLSSKNAQYAVLDRIVKRAQESTNVETDVFKGYDQYVGAKKNYEAFDKIEVNGVKFEMKLMPWTDFNQDPQSGNGYKMMKKADGKGLSKLDCTPEEKRILAAGYVVTELGILLGGKAWDIDRHGGQQNFEIQRSEDGKIEKVVVGIYDTGALRPAPNEEEKTMIANFYAAVIKASIKGDNVTEVMFDEVKKLEDKGMNATYVSDVQRGCIAINDLVEYQKAGVDKNGKPIESQSFGQKDFIKFFGAVLSSGAIDRHISDTLLEKLVTDKSVYMALAKETVKAGVQKVRGIFKPKQHQEDGENLNVVLQSRGSIKIKEHNYAIDNISPRQSANNPYAQSEQKPAAKNGMARKFVRNAQAFILKKQRQRNGL